MLIVTPSQWLKQLVLKSSLIEYPVCVINNGIDLDTFKYTESNFRKRLGFEEKKLLLGVSFDWDDRKGLDVFIELSRRLPDEYRIILVGISEANMKYLPQNITAFRRTQNQQELAEIYSAVDIFVNPTREENYPTVNMEALACGTPVVTFKTGGSPEIVDETCGFVVECDDIDTLEKKIIKVCNEQPFSKEACLKMARNFDQNERFEEYVRLYERIDIART